MSIFERSPVVAVETSAGNFTVHTRTPSAANGSGASSGSMRARDVVVCGSAYMPSTIPGLRAIQRAVLPVLTYVCVTEPLGTQGLADVMAAEHAVTGESGARGRVPACCMQQRGSLRACMLRRRPPPRLSFHL